MEEVFVTIFMDDRDEIFRVPRSNIFFINLSWAFLIVSQISGAYLRASGVASRYNRAAISVKMDISLKEIKMCVRRNA